MNFIEAEFKWKSFRLDKALLTNVMVNGELFRDHIWVEFNDRMKHIVNGDKIRFSAKYHTFIGLDKEGNYVQKKAFKKIRNLEIVRP